jgi:hypothetical protein
VEEADRQRVALEVTEPVMVAERHRVEVKERLPVVVMVALLLEEVEDVKVDDTVEESVPSALPEGHEAVEVTVGVKDTVEVCDSGMKEVIAEGDVDTEYELLPVCVAQLVAEILVVGDLVCVGETVDDRLGREGEEDAENEAEPEKVDDTVAHAL